MKVVRDISVTSAPFAAGTPWDLPWQSPISATNAALVLDFDAGVYGASGQRYPMSNLVNFSRSSDGTHFDDVGSLVTAGSGVARIEHDPVTHAPVGLLLEVGRSNLLVNTGAPANQSVAVAAVPHVLSFYGTGSVSLSGAHAGTYAGSGAFPARVEIPFVPAAGTLDVVFTGQVINPQIEEGGAASSYVASGASSAARADDIATVPLGGWFDGTAGTLVFEGALLDAAANDRLIEIDAGDTSTRLSILWNTSLGLPQFQVWDGGALQAAILPSSSAIVFGDSFRVAIAYSANDFAVSMNGSTPVTDTSGTVPNGMTNLRIGRSVWGGQGLLLAESVAYYAGRLSDAELQALSA